MPSPISPPSALPYAGLTAEQVLASRAAHGVNVLTPVSRLPWWREYLEKFNDPVIRILMIAAVIAIVAGSYHADYIEGVGILLAILLSTFLGFWNEYRANREFELLNTIDDSVPVKAIRAGAVVTVPKRDVVVGDVLLLELGEEIPADGNVLEAVNMQVDESRLTGESQPATKRVKGAEDLQPGVDESAYAADRVLRGTFVADGRGIVEVTQVGDLTDIGTTARAASEEHRDETPLNKQLAKLSKLIGVIGLLFAVFTFFGLLLTAALHRQIELTTAQWGLVALLIASVFLALIRVWLPMVFDGLELLGIRWSPPAWLETESALHWLAAVLAGALLFAIGLFCFVSWGWMTYQPSTWLTGDAGEKLLRYFMVSVTIIVVAVPEGLAMSVTLALAYSMRRMTASNNLVRHLHACETIGAATVICTDKTGTLTMNQMRTHRVHVPALEANTQWETVTEPLNASRAWEKETPIEPWTHLPSGHLLIEALCVNSTAHLTSEAGEAVAVGNPTEGATLLWLLEQGVDYASQRVRFRTIQQWTFSTERKFMGTLGHAPGMPGGILHVKGAPEIILSRCATILTAQGKQPLTADARQQLEADLRSYQQRGMRTLGLAYHDQLAGQGAQSDPSLESLALGLTWLGFIAIHDPIRAEVPASLANCTQAGVAVKMVTGDNPATAREIARQIGLWHDADGAAPDRMIAGADFAKLDEADARQAVKSLKVLARARPMDKLRLVKLLKAQGEVVAVTGDGTNDAPAMNYADVGLAMGKTGTAVAKEASDIILLDDSFKSIVNAIGWGRSLYQNIQRFLVFQLTINLSALTLALIAAFVTGGSTPLTVMQLLWVNLIMDTFAALALATEPPDLAVMQRPPRQPGDFIITPHMAWSILGMGACFVIALCTLLFWYQSEGPLDYDVAQAVLRSADATAMQQDQARITQQRLSIFFTFYVMLQFWNLFNARRFGSSRSVFDHPFENHYFWAIAAIILFGQIIITQYGGSAFSTYPLTREQWGWILAASVLVLIFGELVRLVQRQRSRVASGPGAAQGLK